MAHLEDRFPVVPMTLSIQWVMETAQQWVNEFDQKQTQPLKVVGVREVRAAKWIEIEPKQLVQVQAYWHDDNEVFVEILGHLTAIVCVALQAPQAPQIQFLPQKNERQAPLTAQEVYSRRWMFHGPAYQGISQLLGISPSGIRGTIRNDGVPGALLDNVGQLFGLWVMLTQSEDRVVMPVRLASFQLFGPPPKLGDELQCTVEITQVDRREVKADMTLWYQGQVWARCEAWRDWRFETSGRLWSLMRYPEQSLYSSILTQKGQVVISLAEGISAAASSREFLVGRCLNRQERKEYRELNNQQQRDWLAGRIASKDALRQWLWSQGARPIYPVEIALKPREVNRAPSYLLKECSSDLWPYVTKKVKTEAQSHLSLSITHCEGLALAALNTSQTSHAIGIDLSLMTAREPSWAQVSFLPDELARLEALPTSRQQEALSLWWAIKEATAKCASQLGHVQGLGSPKKWNIIDWKALDLDAMWTLKGVQNLSRGEAQVCAQHDQRVYRVAWWVFTHQGKGFCLALCLS